MTDKASTETSPNSELRTPRHSSSSSSSSNAGRSSAAATAQQSADTTLHSKDDSKGIMLAFPSVPGPLEKEQPVPSTSTPSANRSCAQPLLPQHQPNKSVQFYCPIESNQENTAETSHLAHSMSTNSSSTSRNTPRPVPSNPSSSPVSTPKRASECVKAARQQHVYDVDLDSENTESAVEPKADSCPDKRPKYDVPPTGPLAPSISTTCRPQPEKYYWSSTGRQQPPETAQIYQDPRRPQPESSNAGSGIYTQSLQTPSDLVEIPNFEGIWEMSSGYLKPIKSDEVAQNDTMHDAPYCSGGVYPATCKVETRYTETAACPLPVYPSVGQSLVADPVNSIEHQNDAQWPTSMPRDNERLVPSPNTWLWETRPQPPQQVKSIGDVNSTGESSTLVQSEFDSISSSGCRSSSWYIDSMEASTEQQIVDPNYPIVHNSTKQPQQQQQQFQDLQPTAVGLGLADSTPQIQVPIEAGAAASMGALGGTTFWNTTDQCYSTATATHFPKYATMNTAPEGPHARTVPSWSGGSGRPTVATTPRPIPPIIGDNSAAANQTSTTRLRNLLDRGWSHLRSRSQSGSPTCSWHQLKSLHENVQFFHNSMVETFPWRPEVVEYINRCLIPTDNVKSFSRLLRTICPQSYMLHDYEAVYTLQETHLTKIASADLRIRQSLFTDERPTISYIKTVTSHQKVTCYGIVEAAVDSRVKTVLSMMGYTKRVDYILNGVVHLRGRVKILIYNVYQALAQKKPLPPDQGKMMSLKNFVIEVSAVGNPVDKSLEREVVEVTEKLHPYVFPGVIDHALFMT